MAWVAERDLLEADAVEPVGRSHVEVSRDHYLGAKPEVPVFGALGAAPDGKARDAPETHQVFPQREVIDENYGEGSGFPLESLLSFVAARGAPGLDAFVGAGIEEPLIGADDTGLRRPCDRPLPAHVLGPEAVVVEQEQGRERRGPSLALPDRVGILGCQDVVAPAKRDQGLILLFPSRPAGAVRPEVVVPRDPDRAGESRGRGFERHLELVERLADVAPEDEPVFGMGSPALQGFPVLAMTEVKIADGVKPHLSRIPYNVGR